MTVDSMKMSAIGACLVCSACSSLPDAKVSYPLQKTVGEVVVSRHLSCDVEDRLFVISDVTPQLKVIASGADKDRWLVDVKGLSGIWADSTATFNFHSDGRLAGVNSTSTGKGAEVLKTVASIAGAVFFSEPGAPTVADPKIVRLCDYINGNEQRKDGQPIRSKSLTLTFSTNIAILEENLAAVLRADRRTQLALVQINKLLEGHQLGSATASMTFGDKPKADDESCTVPVCAKPGASDILLKLRAPRPASIKVLLGRSGVEYGFSEELSTTAQIAQQGTDYFVPIPRPALFGGNSFELALNDAGIPTKVTYGKVSGAEQLLSTSSEALKAIQGPSSADQAAAVKGEADLILQRQRLLRCQADPSTCE